MTRPCRRRAEAEREGLLVELRATLESTVDGILVTDLGPRTQFQPPLCPDLGAVG